MTNDVSADPKSRSLAVYQLFEDFVKPGCTAADLRTILTDTRWLQHTNLHVVTIVGGAIPIDIEHGPVFYILLPADTKKGSSYCIFFALSEDADKSVNSVDQCLTMLKNKGDHDDVRLAEFALCYPDGFDTFTINGKKSDRSPRWEKAWYWLKYKVLNRRNRSARSGSGSK